MVLGIFVIKLTMTRAVVYIVQWLTWVMVISLNTTQAFYKENKYYVNN